jgi:integrase
MAVLRRAIACQGAGGTLHAEAGRGGPEVLTAIASLVDAFLADCRARGLSIRTVEWYRDTLRREFLPWCARENITDPAQLTPALVGSYTARLLDVDGPRGPLSRATVRGYVRAVRVFLGWTEKEGGATVGASPKLPKAEKVLFDVLSREEIQQMENVAKTERDKLIVRVLADCGLRLGELLGPRTEDLQEHERGEYAIKVRDKGDRDPLFRVAPALQQRLKRHLSRRHLGAGNPVFVALQKGAASHYALLTKSASSGQPTLNPLPNPSRGP